MLDLHGNQLTQIGGLQSQGELKVLNLAGNQIKVLGSLDLTGLRSLRELNLRRNRLKCLLGFSETQQLTKLFLSNNEVNTYVDVLFKITRCTFSADFHIINKSNMYF